ncbi:MAG: hypothetical protein PHR35_09070 [Kiritimatiellae bacterium]|nr:hypothetical protein [Kiritimatiellia bacterium]
MTIGRCASGLLAGMLAGMALGQGPLVEFSGNGSLALGAGNGKTNVVELYGKTANRVSYLPRGKERGMYMAPGMTLIIPVENFNPQEGTISFWFRPDWTSGDATMHPLLTVKAQPAFSLTLTKGWYTGRDGCYIFVDPPDAGGGFFLSGTLFVGRSWRHYALRWNAKQGQAQVVVDGEAMGNSGPQRTATLKTDVAGPLKARLTLVGDAQGAYAGIKVYDRCLSVPEIMKIAGLDQAARHLQEQRPPPGGESVLTPPAEGSTYVDPVSGLTLRTFGGSNEMPVAETTYNPEMMQTLPVTPHTKWARPLAGDRLRVLMVMPIGFTRHTAHPCCVKAWNCGSGWTCTARSPTA